MIFNMTYAGGGALKYASGNATADGSKTLAVAGLGFRPWAIHASFGTQYGRGCVCDAEGNIAVQYKGANDSTAFALQITDDGFTMEFENFGSAGYNWYAIGK